MVISLGNSLPKMADTIQVNLNHKAGYFLLGVWQVAPLEEFLLAPFRGDGFLGRWDLWTSAFGEGPTEEPRGLVVGQGRTEAALVGGYPKTAVLGWGMKSSHTSISHRIHGTGIFPYIYHTNQPNVGKYTSHPWILWVCIHTAYLGACGFLQVFGTWNSDWLIWLVGWGAKYEWCLSRFFEGMCFLKIPLGKLSRFFSKMHGKKMQITN